MTDKLNTQGPWKAKNRIFKWTVTNVDGEFVAMVENHKDARAIAELPNLLGALAPIASGDAMAGTPNHTHLDTIVTYQKIAREAIAKIKEQ